jgi:hypothetical protein
MFKDSLTILSDFPIGCGGKKFVTEDVLSNNGSIASAFDAPSIVGGLTATYCTPSTCKGQLLNYMLLILVFVSKNVEGGI